MFHHYTDKAGKDSNSDPLYVVHADHADQKKTRYQFHFGSSQFADGADSNKGLSHVVAQHPGLRGVKAFDGLHPALESVGNFNKKISEGHSYKAGFSENGIGMDATGGKVLTGDTLEKAAMHHHNNGGTPTLKATSAPSQATQHSRPHPSVLGRAPPNTHAHIATNPNSSADTLDKVYKKSVAGGKSGRDWP